MTRNRCLGWADGDPVTCANADGSVLALGKVIVRKSAKGSWYCKVEVRTAGTGLGRYGEWVWPDGWVLGQGPRVGQCLECGQDYRTKDPEPSGFCLACDRQSDRDVAADSGIRKPLAYLYGARTPMPKPVERTKGEAAAIAAQKERDEKESPF